MNDPIAAADAVVSAIEPGLDSPGVRSRDVVLVTGPWLAGTTTLLDVLRARLPEHTFVEADALAPTDAPAAVVFVVSAVAAMTESDCAILDLVTGKTDLVVGVVSKIDAHRNWRDVLAANCETVAQRAPRYATMPWIGAAAAPDLGEPQVDELVEVLRERLKDPEAQRRNRLRAWETRLESGIARYCGDSDGAVRRARVSALLDSRDEVVRVRRLSKTERGIALRSQIQQARVQLGHFARNRCTSVRSELAEDVSRLSRRRLGDFEEYVRTRVDEVVDEVEVGTTRHLEDVAAQLGLPAPPSPAPPSPPAIPKAPLTSRRQETQLVMILGAGFGLGVALLVTRLFTGLAPSLTAAGLVVGGLAGLVVTVWVVGIRGLLNDRAVLDRWVSDVIAVVRSAVEERVATRVRIAETALSSELAHREAVESVDAADRVAQIDAELRAHAAETARATAARERRLPPLQQAVAAVRAELYGD